MPNWVDYLGANGMFTCGDSEAICTDSDGGKDYYERGIASGYYQGELSYIVETCVSDPETKMTVEESPYLGELFCNEDNELEVDVYECPDGCKDGKCKLSSKSQCKDSDGGKNYYKKGKTQEISDTGSATDIDSCTGLDGQTLKETYCNENHIYSELYTGCNYGCSDGACIKEKPTCESTDEDDSAFLKGFSTIDNGLTKIYDKCGYEEGYQDNKLLIESYCDGYRLKVKEINCPYGCKDSQCIQYKNECPEGWTNIITLGTDMCWKSFYEEISMNYTDAFNFCSSQNARLPTIFEATDICDDFDLRSDGYPGSGWTLTPMNTGHELWEDRDHEQDGRYIDCSFQHPQEFIWSEDKDKRGFACVKNLEKLNNYECIDLDEGKNYFMRSFTDNRSWAGYDYDKSLEPNTIFIFDMCYIYHTENKTFSPVPECSGEYCHLSEGFCVANNVEYTSLVCSNGCKDGACIQAYEDYLHITEVSFTPSIPEDSIVRIQNATINESFSVYGNIGRTEGLHYVEYKNPSECYFQNTENENGIGGKYFDEEQTKKVFSHGMGVYSVPHNFKFLSFRCISTGEKEFRINLLNEKHEIIDTKIAYINIYQ